MAFVQCAPSLHAAAAAAARRWWRSSSRRACSSPASRGRARRKQPRWAVLLLWHGGGQGLPRGPVVLQADTSLCTCELPGGLRQPPACGPSPVQIVMRYLAQLAGGTGMEVRRRSRGLPHACSAGVGRACVAACACAPAGEKVQPCSLSVFSLPARPPARRAGPCAGDQPHPGGLWQRQDHPQQQQQPLRQAHRCGGAAAAACWLGSWGSAMLRCCFHAAPTLSAAPPMPAVPPAEIYFNRGHSICGALIHTYLLEKSRVVHQQPNERSYHIFYQVGAGRWVGGAGGAGFGCCWGAGRWAQRERRRGKSGQHAAGRARL